MRKLLLIALVIAPVLSFAQGFQVNTEGQKQIGMGHTGTGVAQDGAAVFFNPGAVAMLSQNYLQGGISPLMFKSVFNPEKWTNSSIPPTKPARLSTFMAYGARKDARWKIGMAVYTPFGGLTDWGTTWPVSAELLLRYGVTLRSPLRIPCLASQSRLHDLGGPVYTHNGRKGGRSSLSKSMSQY